MFFLLLGVYLTAAGPFRGSCDVYAHLYQNDILVGVYSGNSWAGSGIAVTECEQGETLRVRTDDRGCHDVAGDPDDRFSWFSVVLIAMT